MRLRRLLLPLSKLGSVYISVSLCVSWLADFPGEKSHGQLAMSSSSSSSLWPWQIERVTKVKCSEK